MIDEGYIKYQCYWHEQESITSADIFELNQWRSRLYNLGLIGQYENGIGYGNLSVRVPKTQAIIISGTQTGGMAELAPRHYTKVTDFDWQENYVTCEGLIKASSETLTHGAVYTAEPQVMAIVHVHDAQLWRKLINKVPTTDPDCAYGTPEMAEEIVRLCEQPQTRAKKIIVMSGHEEGILTFGGSLEEAGQVLTSYFEE